MTDPAARPQTLGALRASGYVVRPVKAEIRGNLIARLRAGEPLFPGVTGYDDTVIPQLTNAILGNQDIIILGERGQAKSRIVRSLINLLDEWTPTLAGTEIPESPYAPVTPAGRQRVAEHGDAAPIRWLHRSERYAEKLATPDITIADLIGEVDPIKIAEGRYLSDELTLHYGLVPRVNRGIFAINELPDLAERIQVGLLNLLEERDVQIRGHRVRLDLDVFIVATANPEDYTNRGRIITPLKDRFGSQIRTHYPRDAATEMAIVRAEARASTIADVQVHWPEFMEDVVATISQAARASSHVNQRSGVSVRLTVANRELLGANAVRRALRLGEREVAPRIGDLAALAPAMAGKIEIEAMEEGREGAILQSLVSAAVLQVFRRRVVSERLGEVVAAFDEGLVVHGGDDVTVDRYGGMIASVPGLAHLVEGLVGAS
ncbi:MAG: sigma 54-interacting transcriptional regulator, partial [Gammaproteobacteria bacterium]